MAAVAEASQLPSAAMSPNRKLGAAPTSPVLGTVTPPGLNGNNGNTGNNGNSGLGYSPTSPAEDAGSGDEGNGFQFAYGPGRSRPSHRSHSTEQGGSSSSYKYPILKVGSRLDQELRLKPYRWIKVGRSPHAQLLLKAPGISRTHCSLRWDPHSRHVELRDDSVTGTGVNGDTLKRSRRILKHGDRISIEGKGKKYVFVIDMRPVGLGFGDPCDMASPLRAAGIPGLAPKIRRRDGLRSQLADLEAQLKGQERDNFEKERLYCELSARLATRRTQDKERENKLQEHLQETQKLTDSLQSSREAWFATLHANQAANELEARPLAEQASDLQSKLEKLKLKKAELERSLNPEKFALIEAGSASRSSKQAHSNAGRSNENMLPGSRDHHVHTDDEEHALEDMPGSGAKGSKMTGQKIKQISAIAKAEAATDLNVELFGDYDSDAEADKGGGFEVGSIKRNPEPQVVDPDDEPVLKKPRTFE
eukprot:TRINITY_DN50083_c0_g1_i1.p1 TRINITY_DN50083_c0_g1~~TRINITY_DN50083_c0_g1_i1.p1  ORF type:complete len:478 (+),score=79.94 TRINITY_DN50083_c0_g1_i1:94-1527(+)